jgi:pimeloyl-ACP methyl ester carboxylesterase
VDIPETHYAKTPDGLSIAYQAVGDGTRDVVLLLFWNAVDVLWEDPSLAHVLRRIADMGRLILVDPRGVGASDPIPLGALPTPEAWTEDVRAVLDEVGSTAASMVATPMGGFLGLLFAATYPERTDSLVLLDSFARAAWAEDYLIGFSAEMCESIIALVQRDWGTGYVASLVAPSRIGDESFRRWEGRWERAAFSPATAAAYLRWSLALDVRSVLPAIRVPTLVMQQQRSRLFPVAFGQYMADHIPGARLRLLPGADLFVFTEAADDVMDEVEEFITGALPVRQPDRALATVLFTDVVSSTERASRLGDRKWRQILDQHDSLVARELDRHRGRKVNTTGDGILATFDGPARAVRCAQAIIESIRSLGVEVRAGLHTGEVELRGHDIGGIAVHIGQRVSALAGPGEVLVSRTVTDLVAGSGLIFEERYRGLHRDPTN